MRAECIYYLRDKVWFTDPYMDDVSAPYTFSCVLVVWGKEPAAEPAA